MCKLKGCENSEIVLALFLFEWSLLLENMTILGGHLPFSCDDGSQFRDPTILMTGTGLPGMSPRNILFHIWLARRLHLIPSDLTIVTYICDLQD